MSGRAMVVRDRESSPRGSYGLAVICNVPGCGRTIWGGRDGMCVECAGMDQQYQDEWYSAQAEKRRQIATRLQNAAWLLAFVFAMSWLGYEIWPYVWMIWQLWF